LKHKKKPIEGKKGSSATRWAKQIICRKEERTSYWDQKNRLGEMNRPPGGVGGKKKGAGARFFREVLVPFKRGRKTVKDNPWCEAA